MGWFDWPELGPVGAKLLILISALLGVLVAIALVLALSSTIMWLLWRLIKAVLIGSKLCPSLSAPADQA